MPYLGLGLHVLIAAFFAIHAVRTGQQLFWLLILFSFPLLGSAVYFVAVYLPQSRLPQDAKKALSVASHALDPSRELREARAAIEFTPTAQNQMRLAAALLESGAAEEAAGHYEACLKGPLASDPEIRLGAARAYLACQRYDEAIGHLQAIRTDQPDFREEQLAVLLARALAGAGRQAEAKAEFAAAASRYGSFETLAEYAIWAFGVGDTEAAGRLKTEIDQSMKRWNRHTRTINAPLLKRLTDAYRTRP